MTTVHLSRVSIGARHHLHLSILIIFSAEVTFAYTFPSSLKRVRFIWLWGLNTFIAPPVGCTASQDMETSSLWTWAVFVPSADISQHFLASGGWYGS